MGLTASYLGGSERFIKVAATPEEQGVLDTLISFAETPYDWPPAPDEDGDVLGNSHRL